MNDISHQQYQKVLKYMQTVNQENFQQAAATMKQHNYNLDMAVNNRFQPTVHPRHQQQHNQDDDEQIVRKYIDFVRRRDEAWNIFAVIFDIVKYILLAVLSLFTSLLPESLYSRFFGTQFEKIYARKLKSKYSHRKLAYYLAKTKNLSSNAVLLVISPNKQHPALLQFLNDQNITKKVRTSFFLSCYVADNSELAAVEGSKDAPQIIALRWNIFEQLVIIGSEKDPKKVTVELLNRWAHESRNLFKRDGNVLVKYRNYIARFHGIQYEEQEEEEVNLIQRDFQKNQIQQQNQAYKMVEEEARKNKELQKERRKKAEEEERIRAEMQQERQLRKMSIPDQPTSGEIVRISFRCPDGSTIFRNFSADEKLQLIYHWVQLNQKIQFQDDKRHFEIMYSYPPEPLSGKKEMRLSEVFESSQEKVVIREL